jgi:formamidopyrimidine-DNA glycosylase
MPELPEVETVRRGLQPVMEGARIAALELRRPDLRFPFPADFAAKVKGRTITALARRAKYLLIHLDNGQTVIAHLGMSGSFRAETQNTSDLPGVFHYERSKRTLHDHVVFRLILANGGQAEVIYNDPRRFGFMLLAAQDALDCHPSLSGLGLEPLGNELSGPLLQRLFEGKSAPLKAALLDQRLIAGLGNIYACEARWRSHLSPLSQAGSISSKPKHAEALARAIRDVLAEAIDAGGSSLRDHRQTDGTLGYFQHRFAVYDRQGDPCLRIACTSVIERLVQSGRSTFHCPECQTFLRNGSTLKRSRKTLKAQSI